MKRRMIQVLIGFAMIGVSIFAGIDSDVGAQTVNRNGSAQQKQNQDLATAEEQAAAARAFEGKMRNVTNTQRREAAARTAARRAEAAAAAAKEGGTNE